METEDEGSDRKRGASTVPWKRLNDPRMVLPNADIHSTVATWSTRLVDSTGFARVM